jgi:hypothetical protein
MENRVPEFVPDLYEYTKYTKLFFQFLSFFRVWNLVSITQVRTQTECEICSFYGSEFEYSEVTVLSRNALSPDSLLFINCTARLNNKNNSLYPFTIFTYSLWFSQKHPLFPYAIFTNCSFLRNSSALWKVRTASLYTVLINFSL